MDPAQLEAIQNLPDLGYGIFPGINTGLLTPFNATGANSFFAVTNPANPANQSALAGTALPDISPLASFNLQQYGIGGVLAGAFGNTLLTESMAKQGILPLGNAGSYMQAYRTREHLKMRQKLSQQLADKDSEGYYRTFRGVAALAGQPFDAQQRDAARNVAETLSALTPTIANFAPDLIDAMAGERGSIQTLANEVLEANRYRIDPTTGRMGYSAETNKKTINDIFETMFSADNLPRMQGIRAGGVGRLYREFLTEGLLGPTGNIREKTIDVLDRAREQGLDLTKIGNQVGVPIGAGMDLRSLTDNDLAKLRTSQDINSRITQADTTQIMRQLQTYIDSIAAMREIFGENGNPNAPMAQLINGLKAFTSGQLQKFDATQLNTMIRDIQSLSQLSGKSLDQLYAMNQIVQGQNYEVLGRHGVHFNLAGTKIGTTAGMAMAQQGAPVGFGALTRAETEQVAMQDFSRSLGSELFNVVGALTRIQKTSGFSKNQAGRELEAIMNALTTEQATYTYTDDAGKQVVKPVPTREYEFQGLAAKGAISNMNLSDFRRELSNRTSNIRTMAESPERQTAVFAQQANEIKSLGTLGVSSIFTTDVNLQPIKDSNARKIASYELGQAAVDAIDNLASQEINDPVKRTEIVAQAIREQAAKIGLYISEDEGKKLAVSSFGRFETITQSNTGQNLTEFIQTKGRRVRDAASNQRSMVTARADLNKSMAGLGKPGDLMQRLFTAVQKQGDRGTEATIQTFLGDALGSNMDMAAKKLSEPLQQIKILNQEIEDLNAQLATASPEKRGELSKTISEKNAQLVPLVAQAREIAAVEGLTDNTDRFNMTDMARGKQALRESVQLQRADTIKSMIYLTKITPEDIKKAEATKLTAEDFSVLAETQNRQERIKINEFKKTTDLSPEAKKLYDRLVPTLGEAAALNRAKAFMVEKIEPAEKVAAQLASDLGPDATIGDLKNDKDNKLKRMLIAERRAKDLSFPDIGEVNATAATLRKKLNLEPELSQEKIDELTPRQKELYKEKEDDLRFKAEELIIAERQLKAFGQLAEGENLMDIVTDPKNITKFKRLDPELAKQLRASKDAEYTKIIGYYVDTQQRKLFQNRITEKAEPSLYNFYNFFGAAEKDIVASNAEQRRLDAISYLKTPGGRRIAESQEKNIREFSNLRAQYLADPVAIRRGGQQALEVVKASVEAEEKLQQNALDYYSGNVGNMLAAPAAFSAAGEKQIKNELAALSKNKAETAIVVERLNEAGHKFNPNELTPADFKTFITLKNQDYVYSMSAKLIQQIRPAALGVYSDPLLKPYFANEQTAKEIGAKLESLYDMRGRDVTREAKLLGMTPDEYRRAISGTGIKPETLKLFNRNGELEQARSAESKLRLTELELRGIDDVLGKAEPGSDAFIKYQTERQMKENEIKQLKVIKQQNMQKAKLDIKQPADVARYNLLLDNQEQADKLIRLRKQYSELKDSLKVYNIPEAKIDEMLDKMINLDETLGKEATQLLKSELGSEVTKTLAQGFGVKTTEEKAKFKSKLDFPGSNNNDERNKSMLARALNRVADLDIGGDETDVTAIRKLDLLTDKYSATGGSEAKRKKLAADYNMSLNELDRMMQQTAFLGLDRTTKMPTVEMLTEALHSVAGRDLAEELRKEEERTIRISGGTLDITGVVTGQGTLNNVVGNSR